MNTNSNDLLEELILDEKNDERKAQTEGSGALRLTEEKNLAGWKTPQNSIHDVGIKATEKLFGTAVDVATLPEATKRGLKRLIYREPSCTKSSEIRVLPKSRKQVRSATECYLTASLHGKCTSSIKNYGKRACQKVYVKMEELVIAFCGCA